MESRHAALRRPSLWKIPATVLVAGLLLTGIFSAQQHDAERRRIAARFQAELEQVETALVTAMEERISEFSIVHDFVESQTAIRNADLRAFLSRRADGLPNIPSDPGLVITEAVDDLAAIQERERALGRPDFSIFSPLPSAATERIVVTHLERDFPVMGRDFVGFDITSFEHFLQIEDFNIPENDNRVHVAVTTYTDLFGSFRLLGETEFPDVYEDAALYLVSSYRTSDETSTGYMAKLESIEAIVKSIANAVPAEAVLTVHLADHPNPVAKIDNRSDASAANTGLLLDMAGPIDELVNLDALTIRLTSGDAFGHDATVLSQTRVWSVGFGVTALLIAAAAFRARQAQRLVDTGLELEIAQTMAATDPLTGLMNRQGLIDAIESPVPQPGTLLFIDIDNFKSVNDGDGHAEGDEVLRAIGETLRTTVRTSDVVCRLHGDEFLVFLPYPVDPHRIEAVRSSISTLVSNLDPRISCSIGVASRGTDSPLGLDQLMSMADADMYSEKRSKR